MYKTNAFTHINGANLDQTCLVQVPRQVHHSIHLHVVLEEAAAERSLVVGLARLGLDGRFHPGLCQSGGDGPDAAHSGLVVLPVRHRVRHLRAKSGAKTPPFGS